MTFNLIYLKYQGKIHHPVNSSVQNIIHSLYETLNLYVLVMISGKHSVTSCGQHHEQQRVARVAFIQGNTEENKSWIFHWRDIQDKDRKGACKNQREREKNEKKVEQLKRG